MDQLLTPPAPLFNPFDPGFRANPYPVYNRIREEDPVHSLGGGAWMLTRYEDVAKAFRDDSRLIKDPPRALSLYPEGPFREYARHTMFFMDPPDYTRVRGALGAAFGQATPGEWEAMVRRIVAGALNGLAGRAEFDVVADFADIIPGSVMAELFGLPAEDRPRLTQWAKSVVAAFEPIFTAETMAEANRTALAHREYFGEWVARRRREPGADAISGMVRAQETFGLSDEEVICNVAFLTVAGSATTAMTIANALHITMTHPELERELRAHPELMENAVEEILRLFPPGHLSQRFAAEELTIGGRTIAAGSSVTLCLAAANRDPERFEDPERLDPRRPAKRNKHLAFGSGIHFCLGAQLARMEIRVALEESLRRLGTLQLSQAPVRSEGLLLQGFREMVVTV